MSQRVLQRQETPVLLPPLQSLHSSIMPEYADSPSDSSSSAAECPYCVSPSIPDLATLAETIPDGESGTLSLATLEDQFLRTVVNQPATESTTQVISIVPRDQRSSAYWSLVTLLCHRTFATYGNQTSIRNFSVSYHTKFEPGDVLRAVCRKVTQRRLIWFKATVTQNDVLVANASALYDEIHPEPVNNEEAPEIRISATLNDH
ncbi:hypothetical protein P170DRAFT_422061 [Aspergillus steynii IBT 23096]|uniref:Thioesterase domain-containing protein n=1 Tax=Aspergillus steynii IBT 23096 TaxID=1392250 RepID=A0A2I2GRM5_9EURO|nr:uncharacterized protein P170DRAFT_422061 [Aspergillus steynii IBT 23096]PLB55525.1 hypothetical protein P170DRAFT_422061 [Aspergillus steynii IBT 23096]